MYDELSAMQSSFRDGEILQIEVDQDGVRVYLRRGMGRKRIDAGCFELNLAEAVEEASQPHQG